VTFSFVQLNAVVTVFLLATSISCHVFWHFSDLYYPLTCSVFHLGSCLICHKSIHASAFQVILLLVEIVFIFGLSVVISMWYHINGPGFSNHHFSFFPFIITWWGTCWNKIVCVCCLISTIIWTNESSLTLCFIPPLTKDILAFRMLVPLGVDSLLFYLYALKSCLKLSSRDHVYIETIQKITYSTIDVWIVLESFHYRQKWQKYQQDDTNK